MCAENDAEEGERRRAKPGGARVEPDFNSWRFEFAHVRAGKRPSHCDTLSQAMLQCKAVTGRRDGLQHGELEDASACDILDCGTSRFEPLTNGQERDFLNRDRAAVTRRRTDSKNPATQPRCEPTRSSERPIHELGRRMVDISHESGDETSCPSSRSLRSPTARWSRRRPN